MAKDYELFQFFKPIIDQALTDAGIAAQMTQSYQPTRQGIEPLIQVFMQKISSKRYGFVKREEVFNIGNDDFDHVETQQMETVFQVGATTKMNPSDLTQLTSSDILDVVAAALQSTQTIESLKANGWGIYRITDITNPFFESDSGEFQSSPSFDFTVTHKQVTIWSNPKVDTFEPNVIPIP